LKERLDAALLTILSANERKLSKYRNSFRSILSFLSLSWPFRIRSMNHLIGIQRIFQPLDTIQISVNGWIHKKYEMSRSVREVCRKATKVTAAQTILMQKEMGISKQQKLCQR